MNNHRPEDYHATGMSPGEIHDAMVAGKNSYAASLEKLEKNWDEIRSRGSVPHVPSVPSEIDTRPRMPLGQLLVRSVVAFAGLLVIVVAIGAVVALRSHESRMQSAFLGAMVLSSNDDLSNDEAADLLAASLPAASNYSSTPASTLLRQVPTGSWVKLSEQERGQLQAAWLAYRRDPQSLNNLPANQKTKIRKAFGQMLKSVADETRNPIFYREFSGMQLGPLDKATSQQYLAAAKALEQGGVSSLGWSREGLANSLLATGWELKAR